MSPVTEIWECSRCGCQLDTSPLGFYAAVQCPDCGQGGRVHTLLANFRIEGVLGIGGMSVVLRARDLVLNRPLAIKVLNETYRNQPERIARFEKECALMAQVRHENVVSVYSAGRARGQFYIAMELVEGTNLELLVSGGRTLPPAQALEITRQVALGLDAAHRAGLLHRDMKPGNILITSEGRAKVLDFGLSLGNCDEDTEEIIWATPFYVPPETLLRQPEDVRTDIYALGMTLRCLLTGMEHFLENPQTPAEILRCKEHLGRIPSRELRADSSLRDLVAHMTAYAPSRRPRDYASLLAELEEVQEAQAHYEREQKPERCQRRRRLMYLYLGGTVSAGLLAAGVVAQTRTLPPVQTCIRADEEPEIAGEQTLCAARRAMEQGEWQQASGLFRQLAETEEEPALGAWSALMVYFFAETAGEESAKADALHLLQRHWENREEVSSAGRDSLEQVGVILKSITDSTAPASFGEEPLAPLVGIQAFLRASAAIERGEQKEADGFLREAEQAFAHARAPYSSLERLVQEQEKTCPQRVREALQRQVREALQRDDTARAVRKLNLLAGDARQMERVPRLRVQKEICDVAGEVFSLLKRRRASSYRPGMTPEQLRDLVFGLGSKTFPEEVYSLAWLLRGNPERAFETNPYREDPDSREPFAVLMRSWEKVLRP